jgi:hypothetical protein
VGSAVEEVASSSDITRDVTGTHPFTLRLKPPCCHSLVLFVPQLPVFVLLVRWVCGPRPSTPSRSCRTRMMFVG